MKKFTTLLALSALGLAACGGSSYSSGNTGQASAVKSSNSGGAYGSAGASTKSASNASSGSTVAVGMYDDYFRSKTITGKPGATVKVKLTNDGSNEHNFKIDSQKQADADVPPGKSATVSVKIPASGSVQFYCEYHKGLGMTGTVKPT